MRTIFSGVLATMLVTMAWGVADTDPASARSCNEKRALSTKHYCRFKKSEARHLARTRWSWGAKERWGIEYSDWDIAKKKRIQCGKTSALAIGSEGKTPGCTNTSFGQRKGNQRKVWRCRAMAIACRE